MKFFFFTLVLIANIHSCDQKSIDGIWINKDDKMSKIIFNKNNYYSIYGTDTISRGTFERRTYTCDSSYLNPTVKADFIWLRGEHEACYEITGLTDSTLAYRYTVSGKMKVFYKSH
jgi:hypothetical protein